MIKSFADKYTEKLYVTGIYKKFPHEVCKIGIRKLDYLTAAIQVKDLMVPPGNRLEILKGNYKGKYSIRINNQYRIVFKFDKTNAYDVEILDYHK